jgi:signal peptidase I
VAASAIPCILSIPWFPVNEPAVRYCHAQDLEFAASASSFCGGGERQIGFTSVERGIRVETMRGPAILPTERENKVVWAALLWVLVTPAVVFAVLRPLGLIRPFSVPAGSMTPAVSAGDHVMMEGFSYLFHKPRRGDVVVFRTDGIPMLPPATIYMKRVVGEPGDRLRIAEDGLYINDQQVVLSNAFGKISYQLPPGPPNSAPYTNLTVPAGQYFVLGDNSSNSLDSRYWGCVPAKSILGRISFCYAPAGRFGSVR